MALYFFVLLTLLKFAVCLPDPNVNVDIDVRVDDKGCGGGGCDKKKPSLCELQANPGNGIFRLVSFYYDITAKQCETFVFRVPSSVWNDNNFASYEECRRKCGGPRRVCMFGDVEYEHGDYLNGTCFGLQKIHDIWNYTGTFDYNCGNCTFGGEPLVYTFDNLENLQTSTDTNVISVDGIGEYIMTQHLLGRPAAFGVNGHFTNKPTGKCDFGRPWTDCIDGASIYEPGIRVKIVIASAAGTTFFKVYVNEEDKTEDISTSVKHFKGDSGVGDILVFEVDEINGVGENCIVAIGSKGLSVALCETFVINPYTTNYPWARIYAMPYLQQLTYPPASQLYGLCNTWNGTDQSCFVNGLTGECVSPWTTATNPFGVPILNGDLVTSWKKV